MERDFFIRTNRVGFSEWRKDDIELAEILLGDPDVTKFWRQGCIIHHMN